MGWPTAILVYVIMWWLSFFVVLPFGQVTQAEAGNVVRGTVASAPVGLNWKRKILVISVIAAALTTLLYVVVTWDLFGLTP